MREQAVPCCICQRATFHDSAVCERGECQQLDEYATLRRRERVAALLARRVSPPRLSEAEVTTPLGDLGTFSADPDRTWMGDQGQPVSDRSRFGSLRPGPVDGGTKT